MAAPEANPGAQRPVVVVVGSVNADLVVRLPRLPGPGETVLDGTFHRVGGGKGANQAVAEARQKYDLFLLDVDNGPSNLVYDANAALYAAPFLENVRDLLHPGGAAAVWSASEAPTLEQALLDVFGDVTTVPLEVSLQDRAETYWLYLTRREPPRVSTV